MAALSCGAVPRSTVPIPAPKNPVRADTAVRPYAEDLSTRANSAVVRWRFESRKGLCRGRLPRLPVRADLRNTKRAGTEACPYDWLLEKQKAFAPSEGETSYGFPVRADAAVRPYAEELSIRANSAFVQWRFIVRKGPCCPQIPILETGTRTKDLEHLIRHRGRAWQPSPTQKF